MEKRRLQGGALNLGHVCAVSWRELRKRAIPYILSALKNGLPNGFLKSAVKTHYTYSSRFI